MWIGRSVMSLHYVSFDLLMENSLEIKDLFRFNGST